MTEETDFQIEFSIPFKVDELGPNPKKIHFDASEKERADLSLRFGLVSMSYLKGTVELKRLSGKKIELKAAASTKIVQTCVVSLKPITSKLDVSFRRVYGSPQVNQNHSEEVVLDLEQADDLDPIIGGIIEIGEAISEELGLEIDPFPRADGIEFDEFGVGPELTQDEVKVKNPFAALADLKKKMDE